MKTDAPRTDAMVKTIRGWKPTARAMNLAYIARQLERENAAMHRELAELREWKTKLSDPATLHAYCVRHLTNAQVAHLFGERMTTIQNDRDAWREAAESLREVLAQSETVPSYDDLRAEALAAFDKLSAGKAP